MRSYDSKEKLIEAKIEAAVRTVVDDVDDCNLEKIEEIESEAAFNSVRFFGMYDCIALGIKAKAAYVIMGFGYVKVA